MSDRRRNRRRKKAASKWDVDLAQLGEVLLGMDPTNREFTKTAEIFMAARWQEVKRLEDADDNSDLLLDLGEWMSFWSSDERGEFKIVSTALSALIFGTLLDKKSRGRVTIKVVVTFGNKCQRTWRELSSRGLGAALKKFSWFKAVVHKTEEVVEAPPERPQTVDLETENAELNAAVDELEEAVADLQTQLEAKDDEIAELKDQIEIKDEQLCEKEEKIETLTTEMWQGSAAFADEMERMKKNLEEEKEAHTAEVSTLNDRIAELQRELAAGQIPDEFCNIPGHTDALHELEELRKNLEEAAKNIARLENDNFVLNAENKRIQRIKDRQEKDIEDLKAELQAQKDKTNELSAKVEDQNHRLAEYANLEEDLRRAREAGQEKDALIAELKALLAQKDAHANTMKEMSDQLRADNDKLTDELAALKHAMEEKHEEIRGLMASTDGAAAELERLLTTRDEEIAQLTLEKEANKHAADHAKEDADEAKRQLAELQAKYDAAQDELARLKEQLEAQMEATREAVAHAKAESDAHREEASRLNDRIAELERQLALAIENQIPDDFCNISGHVDAETVQTLRDELEEAATMIAEVENEKENVDHELARLRKELEAMHDKLQTETLKVDELETELRKQKNEYEVRLIEFENLQENLRHAREVITEKDGLIEEQKILLGQKDEHIEAVKQLSGTLRDENDKLKDELAALKHALDEKIEEIRGLMASTDGASADLERLLLERDAEISRLTVEHEGQKHSLARMNEENEELKKRLQELQQAVDGKDRLIIVLKERLDNEMAESQSLKLRNRESTNTHQQLQISLKQQGTMVGTLEQQITALREELVSSRQQQSTFVSHSHSQNNQTHISYQVATHSTSTITEGKESVTEDGSDFQTQIAFRDGRIQELEKQLAKSQRGVKRASLMVSQVQQAGVSEVHVQQIVQLRKTLEEATIAKTEASNKRVKQNAALWRQLGNKIVENEKLVKHIRHLEKMLEASESRRDAVDEAFQNQVLELRNHVSSNKEQVDQDRIFLESELKSMTSQRNTWMKECKELRQKHDHEIEKLLQRLKRQQDRCHELHGTPKRDRVSQVRIAAEQSSTAVTETDSFESATTSRDPGQIPSDSVTGPQDPINLNIVDLERVLVQGNYKVGILPKELYCCGLLCFGADCYCCNKPRRNTNDEQPSKAQVGQ